MINIYFNRNFYSKLKVEDYPLKGFWYDMVDLTVPSDSDNIHDYFLNNVRLPGSQVYPSNTLISNNHLKIEINFDNKSGNSNVLKWIRLYYIDLVRESSSYDYLNSSGSNFNINRSDPTDLDNRLLNRFAGVINLDENLVNSHPNHIIDIEFDHNLVCNWFPITKSITNSRDVNQYYDHIQSSDVGQVNTFDQNISPNQLMFKSTTQERLRETRTLMKFSDRDGVMTIKKSGIIQL